MIEAFLKYIENISDLAPFLNGKINKIFLHVKMALTPCICFDHGRRHNSSHHKTAAASSIE